MKYDLDALVHRIVYTGPIDAFYGYKFGRLDYRSLRFDHRIIPAGNYQGNAIVNYTDYAVPYTRTVEHQFFDRTIMGKKKETVVTWEYPQEYNGKNEPFYPVNDEKNMKIYRKYKHLSERESHIYFGGRLARYRYYDMHQVIGAALHKIQKVLSLNDDVIVDEECT